MPPAEKAQGTEEIDIVEDELEVTPEPGEEIEAGEEAEDKEADDDGEVEVVLEGEEEDPAPQNAIPKRVRKLLERNTLLQTDLETQSVQSTESAQEIARLNAELAIARQPKVTEMPLAPIQDADDFDGDKFAQAQTQYQTDMQVWIRSQTNVVDEDVALVNAQNQRVKVEQQKLQDHYERADSLNVADYDDNEAKAVSELGRGLVKAIAVKFPNSVLMINYLGKNSKAAQEIASLDKTDPDAGIEKLWELNFKLKTQPRKRSKAPNPEERVQGSAAATTDEAFKAKMDKAASAGDIKLFRELKKEAREKGIKT